MSYCAAYLNEILYMINMVVHSQSVSRHESFITELAGVGRTINVSLYMFFHVSPITTRVITSLAVK